MFDEIISLSPAHFFSFSCDAQHYTGKQNEALGKKYKLPDLSYFYDTPQMGSVFLGWHEKGIFVTLISDYPLSDIAPQNFRSADAIELFFDTRDVKTSYATTRFCHHFVFFPQINDDSSGEEVTHFRGEEKHTLAESDLLFIETVKHKKGFRSSIFIPKEALFGYDPSQFDRLGFAYRINWKYRDPQYFSVSSSEISIEDRPTKWATLKLVK